MQLLFAAPISITAAGAGTSRMLLPRYLEINVFFGDGGYSSVILTEASTSSDFDTRYANLW